MYSICCGLVVASPLIYFLAKIVTFRCAGATAGPIGPVGQLPTAVMTDQLFSYHGNPSPPLPLTEHWYSRTFEHKRQQRVATQGPDCLCHFFAGKTKVSNHQCLIKYIKTFLWCFSCSTARKGEFLFTCQQGQAPPMPAIGAASIFHHNIVADQVVY